MLGIVAQHLKPGMWFKVDDEVGDGAFRRLAQKVDLELLARLAKSDCLGREPGVFNCEAMDWFLERARALGVEHRPPAPILLGRHVLELGLKPGPRVGRNPEGGLRAAAGRDRSTTLDEALAAARDACCETRPGSEFRALTISLTTKRTELALSVAPLPVQLSHVPVGTSGSSIGARGSASAARGRSSPDRRRR